MYTGREAKGSMSGLQTGLLVKQRYELRSNLLSRPEAGRHVWLARDRRLGRSVVLKAGTGTHAERIAHESRLLGAVSSPYVVSVFDVFDDEPRLWMVIELFARETVETLLERRGGTVGESRAVPIVMRVLDAYEAMHAAGVLHRDLHPGHISYRNRHRLKLFDLDLSINASRPAGELSCRNPHTFGTWETMAPEEFEEGRHLTRAANVYSAGVLLYHLLTGSWPLDYKVLRSGWQDLSPVEQQEVQGELHRDEPVRYPGAIRSPVRTVLERALAKRPADRYQSARQFCEDLEQAM